MMLDFTHTHTHAMNGASLYGEQLINVVLLSLHLTLGF